MDYLILSSDDEQLMIFQNKTHLENIPGRNFWKESHDLGAGEYHYIASWCF